VPTVLYFKCNLLVPVSIIIQDLHNPLNSSKQGLYHVGHKIFHNKENAIAESTRYGQPVVWDFNSGLFRSICESPALGVSLNELYRQRAQQLRDQYDYLILAFSGGADSDNILQTFVDNGIHLDEVWADWPAEIIEKSNYVLNTSADATNMPAEYQLTIKPTLERLRLSNPEIKIHASDTSTSWSQIETEQEMQSVLAIPMMFSVTKRWKYIQNYITTKFHNRRVCLITGVDRCNPTVKNGEYGFVFVDSPFFIKSNYTIHGNPYIVECFYWTPDMPHIPVEQARKVWHYFLNNRDFFQKNYKCFLPGSSAWRQRNNAVNRIVTTITYPKWDWSKHQVDKARFINNDHYNYVKQFQDVKFYQGGVSTLNNLLSIFANDTYFDKRPGHESELMTFQNFHSLGKITDV